MNECSIESPATFMRQDGRFLRGVFNRFLFPTVLSVLGGTVNVLIDSAIVGNMMGAQALAAINLCGPIFLLCSTIGSLIGSGAGLLAAAQIGRAESEKGCVCYTLCVALQLLFGTFLTIGGLLFLRPAVKLFGADDALFAMALAYAQIAFWGAPVKCLLYVPFNFLRLDGKPAMVSVSLLTMTALNGVLDYLFIKAGWGLAGASLASVLATCLGAAVGFICLHGGSFRLTMPRGGTSMLREMLMLGTPPALNNLLSMVRMILLNRILMAAGGSAFVAIFTMVGSVSDFTLCVISGVPQTSSPLVGIYNSERNNPGMRLLIHMQLCYGGILIGSIAAAIALAPALICTLFGLMQTAQAVWALRLFALSLPMAMLCSILIYFYNASGQVPFANGMTFCRVFLFAVLPAAVLSWTGFPVWWFYPLSELLTLAVLFVVLWRKAQSDTPCSPILLLDEAYDRMGKVIDFSVEARIDEAVRAAGLIGGFCNQNSLTARQAMAVSLSIEEMLTILIKHCFQEQGQATVDVRVFVIQGEIGLRIRNAGKQFNPIDYYQAHQAADEMGEALGIRMILKLAKSVCYQRTFGVNTLTILL
ncbi:MATE family efflux transporter [Anaerotruncus colihominis]|uniref:MATE family efflux transporter n=2 Tax=Anaerotruncus colihominis TaxID=169435 RepID=UPI0026EF13BF|nr:MATE family efflux transporter [Anaerotruncus colihominis]